MLLLVARLVMSGKWVCPARAGGRALPIPARASGVDLRLRVGYPCLAHPREGQRADWPGAVWIWLVLRRRLSPRGRKPLLARLPGAHCAAAIQDEDVREGWAIAEGASRGAPRRACVRALTWAIAKGAGRGGFFAVRALGVRGTSAGGARSVVAARPCCLCAARAALRGWPPCCEVGCRVPPCEADRRLEGPGVSPQGRAECRDGRPLLVVVGRRRPPPTAAGRCWPPPASVGRCRPRG